MNLRQASRVASVSLVVLLLIGPGVGRSQVSGITTGMTVDYSLLKETSYVTPNGPINHTSDNAFSIGVNSVDNSVPPGVIGVTLTYTLSNNNTISAKPTSNLTVFFDPYDNKTYLAGLGFYPFIYTDVKPGTARVNVSVTVTGSPAGTVTVVNSVNATVWTSPGYIFVNYTEKAPRAVPAVNYMKFNSTNGIMLYGDFRTNVLGVEQDIVYILTSLSVQQGGGGFLPIVALAIVGVFAVLAVAAVVAEVRSRKRGKKRFRGVTRSTSLSLMARGV